MNKPQVQQETHDEPLTKTNLQSYALEHYNNPHQYHRDEFEEDFRIFFYVKKLLTRHRRGDSVNHHMTLNHVITLANVFGPKTTVRILRFLVEPASQASLNSIFFFLSILPHSEEKVNLDLEILKFLETL